MQDQQANKYYISRKAEQDIEAYIWQYGIKLWGIARTRTYYRNLIAKFEILATAPQLARERSEFTPPVRIHPHASHTIIYRIEGTHIHIIRVLHGNMDLDTQLAQ